MSVSDEVSSKNLPLLRRFEHLVSKFIRPPRVRPVAARSPMHQQSEYKSIVLDNKPIFVDPMVLDDAFSLNLSGTQKPKSNSFNYNVYMKCFIHELRTPISTISMGLNVLKKDITDADQLQTIRDINQSAIFIEDILTKFATIQEGNIELNVFEPFSLEKLVTSVHTLLLYQFNEPDLHFSHYIDSTMTLWNYGDVHNIKHVLLNLLKNAIKYRTPDRNNTISITVSHLPPPDADERQTVFISVKDTNNHLLPHIKEHLFETFNSTSGSGMGLYICKTIVKLHGGTMTHNFIEPVGNEFVVTLHLTMCHDSQLQLHTPVSRPVTIKMTRGHLKYSVLIVDDSVLNRKMMYKILQTMPLFGDMYSAEDGEQSVVHIQKHSDKIDMVLLDKNMPVMGGWKAVVEMRRLGYNKLVIGLTGEDSPDELQGFVDRGADYVIAKPFDAPKLNLLHTFVAKYGIHRQANKTIQLVNDQLEWVPQNGIESV